MGDPANPSEIRAAFRAYAEAQEHLIRTLAAHDVPRDAIASALLVKEQGAKEIVEFTLDPNPLVMPESSRANQ